jgi:hypothetical protein
MPSQPPSSYRVISTLTLENLIDSIQTRIFYFGLET